MKDLLLFTVKIPIGVLEHNFTGTRLSIHQNQRSFIIAVHQQKNLETPEMSSIFEGAQFAFSY
jgi:hypothetical protein